MDVIVLQFLRDTLPDSRMKQRQVDRQIRIFMDDIHKYFAHIQRDGQFLLTLADERLLLVSPGSTLPPTNSHSSPLALWAGRWQIINLS